MDLNTYSQLVKAAYEAYAKFDAAEARAKASKKHHVLSIEEAIECCNDNVADYNGTLAVWFYLVVLPRMGRVTPTFGPCYSYMKAVAAHLPKEIKAVTSTLEVQAFFSKERVRKVIPLVREIRTNKGVKQALELVAQSKGFRETLLTDLLKPAPKK